jgi:hypothetical protein
VEGAVKEETAKEEAKVWSRRYIVGLEYTIAESWITDESEAVISQCLVLRRRVWQDECSVLEFGKELDLQSGEGSDSRLLRFLPETISQSLQHNVGVIYIDFLWVNHQIGYGKRQIFLAGAIGSAFGCYEALISTPEG